MSIKTRLRRIETAMQGPPVIVIDPAVWHLMMSNSQMDTTYPQIWQKQIDDCRAVGKEPIKLDGVWDCRY